MTFLLLILLIKKNFSSKYFRISKSLELNNFFRILQDVLTSISSLMKFLSLKFRRVFMRTIILNFSCRRFPNATASRTIRSVRDVNNATEKARA